MAKQPAVIHVPMGLPTWEADNWRVVAEWIRQSLSTTNKVDSPTTGLGAVSGKVKIDQYDMVSDYLEEKIVAGSDIDLIESKNGLGSKKYTANLNVITQAAEPTTMTAGMLWHDTDARFGTPFNIGDGETGIDYEVVFKGETHEGSYTWMEDEDYLKCSDDLLMNATENVYFRDTAISINSANDGHLDITADTSIDLNGPTAATGMLATSGGRSVKVRTITDTDTASATDEAIVCNKGTAMTLNLVAASGSGRKLYISSIGAGTVTIDPASGDTINGDSTFDLYTDESLVIVDYAANAWVVT